MTTALTTAHISLDALRHNLSIACQCAGNSKVMAVIKGDGYGHGLVAVAETLQDADTLAVARLEEAIELRHHGIDKPLAVLSGISCTDAMAACHEYRLQPVIHSTDGLAKLADLGKKIPFWLKVDSGMHRLGLTEDELAGTGPMKGCVGVMSHLADAEILDHPNNRKQQQLFDRLRALLPAMPASLANSAAVLLHPPLHYDWVRPGIMLYGANPSLHDNPATRQLQAVMTLTSTVIGLRDINTHERVGYNGNWQAHRPSRIATIAIGYADGYPRHAANGTPVWINGRSYPLVGNVSMDLITVDVTGGNVSIGDTVELWGRHVAAGTVAEMAGTISYQLFTGVTKRVPRIYQDTGRSQPRREGFNV